MVEAAHTLDAPMTRAQKFQWHLERGIADGVRRLPDSCDTSSVLELVGSLQRQYEILRTTIEIVDGAPCQRVHESGEPVVVVDVGLKSDVAARASALAEEFTSDTVGHVGQFLVKFYLLRQGADCWLAIIADSTAIDRAFYQVLDLRVVEILGETQEPATGGGSTLVGLQPVQVALREDSPDGRAERQEAREYLRKHFSTAPPVLHPRNGFDEVRAGRYYRCTLTLSRADEIFADIIETTGRLPSAVILGIFSYLMCWRADAPSCTVNVSMENRHTQDLRTALCATAQRAPIGLRMSGEVLGDAVTAAETALSAGYPVAGRYDPLDLIEERARAEAQRGLCLTPDLAFNFNPPLQGWTALLESAHTDRELHDVRETRVDTKSTNETSYEYAASLSVRWSDTHTARLSIHADSQAVKRDECAAVLRGIETGLKESARGHHHVGVAEIAESARLGKMERHPREVRIDGIWYDLAAIENCLLEIDAVEEIQFSSDFHRSGSPTVRAVVSDGTAMNPSDLRTALLEHVGSGALAAILDCYELADAKLSDA